MFRTMLKSKIHCCRVTETNLYYEGSITVDSVLLAKANILPGEKVEVLNLNTGVRLETYALEGKRNSGVICLNGPAARNAYVEDKVIILSYFIVPDQEAKSVKAKIVKVNERNRIKN